MSKLNSRNHTLARSRHFTGQQCAWPCCPRTATHFASADLPSRAGGWRRLVKPLCEEHAQAWAKRRRIDWTSAVVSWNAGIYEYQDPGSPDSED